MKLEVLMSCMNQSNFDLTEKMNLTTDILIVNQTNKNKYEKRIVNGNIQRMISNTQKGLSKTLRFGAPSHSQCRSRGQNASFI